MSRPIRVLLADDHSIVRFGYQQLLSRANRIEVIAEAENCADALSSYRNFQPDVVILDLSMPIDSRSEDVQSAAGGFEAIRRIRSYDERARILVVTGFDNSPYPQRAIQAGVCGYVSKRNASSELEPAVLAVAAGNTFYSKSVAHLIDDSSEDVSNECLASLTSRELEVFSLLAEGHSVTAIVGIMHVSPKTVHAHRANLLRKLNLSSTIDLVRKAMEIGMLHS